jgi:hypothetical protein
MRKVSDFVTTLIGELLQGGHTVLGGGHVGDLSGNSLGVAPQVWGIEQTPQCGFDAVGGGTRTHQGNAGTGGRAGLGVAELVGALGQAELRDTVGQRTEQRARAPCEATATQCGRRSFCGM